MCGIFGFFGKKNAAPILIEGLKRLVYRGYDSWGIAVLANDKIYVEKKVGKVSDIKTVDGFPQSTIGIAHTRWATHGGVTQINAHPHFSTDKSFVLAQNGIVENYEELKKNILKKGYRLISQTDTEVIVRLIEDEFKKNNDLKKAVRNVFQKLKGRNTIIILTKNGEIIAARNGSPLVIGLNNQTNETFFSSDVLSFAPFAQKMIVVDNGQLVYVKQDLNIYEIKSGKKITPVVELINLQDNKVNKEGFPHFMIKEIYETPFVLNKIINDHQEYIKLAEAIKDARHVYIIGSGTAGAAAAQIAFYLREYAEINAISLIGADAKEYYNLFTKNDLIIAPSQSGETADVLEVLEFAKTKKMKVASFVNMPGSMMTRLSDFKFMAGAGPEICVMSTKIFVSQIAWGYLISKIIEGKMAEGVENLKKLQKIIAIYLKNKNNHQTIKSLAKKLIKHKDIFLLSKAQNFQIIKEGMIKIIEGSYLHAHAIPAGDLKHYAITLIEKGVPVIIVISNDSVKADIINAANQVKARGADVIGITPFKTNNFDYCLKVPGTGETSAIINIIPLQLLAYYMAVGLENNVDKPRNIAKSVTVK